MSSYITGYERNINYKKKKARDFNNDGTIIEPFGERDSISIFGGKKR
jgi:hypothetical protein